MADIDVVEKPARGSAEVVSGRMSWIWALVAVLAVGGLMAWLAVQSERVSTAAVVEEAPARSGEPAPGAAGGAETAVLADVAGAPDPFIGRRLQFDDVEVAATLGPNAFWGDVPGANPFLVVFSPNVTQAQELQPGQTYDLQGVVNVVSDAELDQWVASGAIREGARDEAAFATHYLLAEQIVQ